MKLKPKRIPEILEGKGLSIGIVGNALSPYLTRKDTSPISSLLVTYSVINNGINLII